MLVTQKIELKFKSQEDIELLEHQMAICNKLYNMLLEEILASKLTEREYISRNGIQKRIKELVKKYPYLSEVHPSALEEVGKRLITSFKKYYAKICDKPKFRSNEKYKYSLLYSGRQTGLRIDKKKVFIPFGKKINENGEVIDLGINATLTTRLKENRGCFSFRILKQMDKYYLTILEARIYKHLPKTGKKIAIDQNHKNFFVAVDSDGKTYEIKKLIMNDFYADEIDSLMKLRSKCDQELRTKTTKSGTEYHVHSKRYSYLTKKIQKVYNKNNEQVKQALYVIANTLVKKYDTIAIGDYVPRVELSLGHKMNRAMLNKSEIGKFREILKFVCEKYGKTFELVDESGTTATCFNCGDVFSKDPTIRSYTCPCCNKSYNRDVNSAINIGLKANIFSKDIFVKSDLTKPNKMFYYNYKKAQLLEDIDQNK